MDDQEFLDQVRSVFGELAVRTAKLVFCCSDPEPQVTWNQTQVAKHLGVAVNTLKSWIAEGKFPPATTNGTQKSWPQQQVEAWIDRHGVFPETKKRADAS